MKLTTIIKSTLVTSAFLVSSLSFAANIEVNANGNDLAIKGYDTVSYFTKGMPIKGSNKFTSAYNGAIYQFSSADNRDLFKAEPSKYAPQYGGFCAFGVTMNKKFDTDPAACARSSPPVHVGVSSPSPTALCVRYVSHA